MEITSCDEIDYGRTKMKFCTTYFWCPSWPICFQL